MRTGTLTGSTVCARLAREASGGTPCVLAPRELAGWSMPPRDVAPEPREREILKSEPGGGRTVARHACDLVIIKPPPKAQPSCDDHWYPLVGIGCERINVVLIVWQWLDDDRIEVR